ncbi:MAG: Ig-like domain-containing protein [Chitinophagaceae bacterium]|nr:Ig-like domain-containing protein [Chitinophagaceae bacterium]
MITVIQRKHFFIIAAGLLLAGCSKKSGPAPTPEPVIPLLTIASVKLNGNTVNNGNSYYNINTTASVRYVFSAPVNRTTVASGITIKDNSGTTLTYSAVYANGDSVLILQPAVLPNISLYSVAAGTILKSVAGKSLSANHSFSFVTKIDSTSKFPLLTDDELLTKVQQQTFKYFWDFAHPVSGLARERNNGDDNTVTSGGSGFGIMTIPVAINRNFITRADGLARMQKIVGFLKNTTQTFHGAFPHWLHGGSGIAIAFSTKDDGADLVETSYLIAGLMTARQYFNSASIEETTLRTDINTICNNVDWSWFRRNNENVLYWHWSPVYNWDMNVPIRGWNECLITYIMAASSTTHGIPANVYSSGWAGSGTFTNGATYFGYQLPLGPSLGGPLFFSHYSFLGVDPTGLQDVYANYTTQTKNHTLINYTHCKTNPNNQFGYSENCWGLTASDIKNGYTASSPTNDVGFIAPTAALSSFPYTPAESMKALKFFYYVLGDKLWKDYGFVDAFSLKETWFAGSFLAIDQGPIIVMIENYRTGLLWNLFTSCPEVKTGMRSLGFTAPYL